MFAECFTTSIVIIIVSVLGIQAVTKVSARKFSHTCIMIGLNKIMCFWFKHLSPRSWINKVNFVSEQRRSSDAIYYLPARVDSSGLDQNDLVEIFSRNMSYLIRIFTECFCLGKNSANIIRIGLLVVIRSCLCHARYVNCWRWYK